MEFDKFAESYDTGLMGKGSKRFYVDLVKTLDIRDGDAVLDVGCGTGTVLSYVHESRNIRGYGLDVSEQMIAVAKEKNPEFSFVTGDSAKLPYEDGSMDVIMACMAYHHFPEQKRFRKEALRVLKPGGSLYICDPRFPAPVRFVFNTFFRDAGFHSTVQNTSAFEETGFITKQIVKDRYVQVLHFEKRSNRK